MKSIYKRTPKQIANDQFHLVCKNCYVNFIRTVRIEFGNSDSAKITKTSLTYSTHVQREFSRSLLQNILLSSSGFSLLNFVVYVHLFIYKRICFKNISVVFFHASGLKFDWIQFVLLYFIQILTNCFKFFSMQCSADIPVLL